MDGNIFNSSGDHVGRIMGGEIFGLRAFPEKAESGIPIAARI
jgi:hypothetical protein